MSSQSRSSTVRIVKAILILAACSNAIKNFAAEPSYFRLNGGISGTAGALPDNFDAPEALVWRVPLDAGHSTPILRGGKIFFTTYRSASKELATVALEERTGQ